MATLHSIINDLVAGVDGPQVDLRLLADEQVTGFIVDRPMSVIQAIEQLQYVYRFDVEEAGGVLRFITRQDRPPQEVIAPGDTLSGVAWDRVQEVEVPRSISLTFTDSEQSPDFSTVIAQRSLVPTFRTVDSQQRQDIKVFVALDTSQARQVAQAILVSAWAERDTFRFVLPPSYILLNPSDHIRVTNERGTEFTCRITEVAVGADLAVEVTARVYDRNPSLVTAAGGAQPGGGASAPSIAVNTKADVAAGSQVTDVAEQGASTPGEATLVSLPGLADEELAQQAGATSVGYAVLNQLTSTPWRSAAIERQAGFDAWTEVLAGPQPPTPTGWLGDIVPRNPGFLGYNVTRAADTCDVILDTKRNHRALFDSIISVTEEDFYNEVSRIAIVRQSDGGVGVIAFRQVDRILTTDRSSYYGLRLTGMIRGMRGTEQMDRDYQPGDYVIFLPRGAPMPWFSVVSGDFGERRNYRARFGSYVDPADTYVHTPLALYPYAPFNIRATLEADLSTTITWTRRARFGGEDDLTLGDEEIPIGEQDLVGNDYERYDIRLVIPTHDVDVEVEDLEGPTYSYPLEDKVAAGYNAADPEPVAATVTVWQKSAVLGPGRGFPGRANVEI